MEKEKETAKVIDYTLYVCPYCNHEIMIPECRGEPLTVEAYRQKIRQKVKEIKQKRG